MEGKEWGSGGTDVMSFHIHFNVIFAFKIHFKILHYFLLCTCIHVCVFMHGHVGAHGRQKKVLSSL